MTTCLGIDLAWSGDHHNTGGVCLRMGPGGLEVAAVASLSTLEEILGFVEAFAEADTTLAIDAPLVVVNPQGARPCEVEISRRFGYAHACAYPTNLQRFPDLRSLALVRRLEALGFSHPGPPEAPARRFMEVYPHTAQLALFRRDRIIRYKKGPVAARRAGLEELRGSIRQHLTGGDPALRPSPELEALLAEPLVDLRGRALKRYEDSLDALICAYTAALFRHRGLAGCEMIGDLDTGYIISPRPRPDPA